LLGVFVVLLIVGGEDYNNQVNIPSVLSVGRCRCGMPGLACFASPVE